ncbi:cysteine hydrolase family protein [Gracilibacillus dipsosauri]|uniref:Isochorismatase n=1 Tax=Gracilibacillus dipsosauri TaxID=178340 RepID=A0A317L2R7_9BACI|nr:isochorismatase family cysteine hydrolase [Gracilibacillus dipsosauri]PWU70107.1 isochorismatase [Gracilibacillus dipsosauri]
MKDSAVLIIDLINDFHFSEGDLLLNETKRILPNIKRLKQYAKKHSLPIIYVNDHYDTWETDYKKIADKCKSETNQDIIAEGLPSKEDYFLIKPKLSGFFRTTLPSLLEQLGIKHLIIAGIAGNICVLFTANDAHMRGYTLHVPENCIASNTRIHNEEAIRLMVKVMKAKTDPI